MNNKLLIDSLINIDDSGMPQPPTTRQLIDRDVRELYRRDTSKDKQKYIKECIVPGIAKKANDDYGDDVLIPAVVKVETEN